MLEPSVFTKIINGEIPAYKIYEDDKVVAFLDRHPLQEGHTLVVPKCQVDHLWDLDDQTYVYLCQAAQKIAKHIRSTLNCPRVGAVVEGFGVPHAHIHLVPIYERDQLQTTIKLNPTEEVLKAMAARLAML